MALMELGWADTDRLQREGRSFSCETCPEVTQKARRCREDRWDFTSEDGTAFPVYISRNDKGETGPLYGFCPAKVARDDPATVRLFQLLMIAADTGGMLRQGGTEDQPDWFIDLLAWFLPKADMARFAAKAQMILGTGGSASDKTKAIFAASQRASRGSHPGPAPR